MHKIIRYIKNLLKYMRDGGVVYMKFDKVMPDRRFEGKRVLITGGSSGIGFETAREYLAEGAEVIITGRHENTLRDAAVKLASDKLHILVWDVSEPEAASAKINQAASLVGSIDFFINNAGVYAPENLRDYDVATYDSIMATNTRGLFFLCQSEKQYFINSGVKGRIVNVCSVRGLTPGFDPYSISKWGAVCLTKGLAKDLIKHGIIVNGVAPGIVITNISGWSKKQDIRNNAYSAVQPTCRYTLVEEVAGMILYLTSDLASNIVGHVIPIDGGWTLQ